MHRHSHSHKDGDVVLREADLVPVRESAATADLLGYIADIDARRLYARAGYSSIHAYCVERMHLSEDAAYKRIHAARAALEFPALFVALAENRIHLAAIGLLTPHLDAANVDELIAASTYKSKAEVAKLVAERFGRRKARGPVEALIESSLSSELAPGQVEVVLDASEQEEELSGDG